MKVRHLWCGIVLLCLMGLAVRAEVVVTTEEGSGADTYLTNDSQQGPDTVTGGEERIRAFRQVANSRSKTGFIRFDLNGIGGELDNAIITFDATLLKGGSKSVDVYGLIDGSADFWNESTITYNTAPCMVPNPPTDLGKYKFVDGTVVLLGTLTTPALPDGVVYPVPFSSTTTALPLGDFLKKDTNGFVTFVFIGTDNETEVASKEHATFNPPRLTLPNCYAVKRASNPVPANNIKVLISEYDVLSWTNPEPNLPGGVVTCDVYFGDKEPNALLPHYGLPLLAAGISGNSVPMPALSVYKTYYWVVDTYDTSRDPEYVQGKVWTFLADNSAPQVDAGATIYAYLTDGTVTVTMAPSVSDDGRPDPPGKYTVLWEVTVEDPDVVINSPTIETTTVTITRTGSFVLKLTVNDGQLSNSDLVTINVYADACQAAHAVPGYSRPAGDINDDCEVDLIDLAQLAADWLESTALVSPLP